MPLFPITRQGYKTRNRGVVIFMAIDISKNTGESKIRNIAEIMMSNSLLMKSASVFMCGGLNTTAGSFNSS
jgi:hypothetical protein